MTNYPNNEAGLDLVFGTYEDAKLMIGASGATIQAEWPINRPMIEYYCSAMEDRNLSYWSEDFAEEVWGGAVCPPGMLQMWTIPLKWRPDGARTISSMIVKVPLPGDKVVVVSSEMEYFTALRVGDVVSVTDQVLDVSGEKTTRLGVGHFVTTGSDYRNQNGEKLASGTTIAFRYLGHTEDKA